jgi:hypothetical protein
MLRCAVFWGGSGRGEKETHGRYQPWVVAKAWSNATSPSGGMPAYYKDYYKIRVH